MNCFFCQNECRKENDEGRWSCSHHAVTVHLRRYDYHEGDGLPDFLYFTHDHKDKEYTVWFIFALMIRDLIKNLIMFPVISITIPTILMQMGA